jgi:GNAT superfamily N-acetyltransferase
MSTSTVSLPQPAMPPAGFRIRPAELRDVQAIVTLIRELAEFEQLTHLLQVTPEKLRPHLFGEKTVAEALVAEIDDGEPAGAAAAPPARAAAAPAPGAAAVAGSKAEVVAFALFFTNFSTFLAQPGLYLEDLFVRPVHRGRGIGGAMLRELARMAVARGCGRFEWSVLDWNEHAIRFYKRMGADVMDEWRICRVTGDALEAMGDSGR